VGIVTDFNKKRAITLNQINVSTVKRCLRCAGLFGRRPSKKPFISKKNRMARLKFAHAHKKWSVEDWSKVLWSDESKYNLVSSNGIRYIQRRKNERFNVRYQVQTIKHGGGHVMVWGCFSRNGVGPLVQINGTMTAETYNAIITESMISFSHENMGNDWIFQHDNDPKYTSKLVKETYKRTIFLFYSGLAKFPT